MFAADLKVPYKIPKIEHKLYPKKKKVKEPDEKGIPFTDFIRAMPLHVFINLFAYVLDNLEGSPTFGQMIKLTLWKDQVDLCKEYEEAYKRGDTVFLLLKARQIGASTIFALHKIKRLIESVNYKCAIFSCNLDAARNFLSDRVTPVLKHLPKEIEIEGVKIHLPWPKFDDLSGSITMENGSFIKILPATREAGISYTVNDVILDEAAKKAFALWGEEIFTSVKPLVQRGGGMITVLSTPASGTWYNRFARKIIDGEVQKASYFFANYKTDPSYTQEKYDSDLSQAPDEILFRAEHPLTVEECFLKREGAVYPDLDIRLEVNGAPNPKAHVGLFDPQFQMVEAGWQFIIGMDLGYNHKNMVLFSLYDYRNDQLMIFDELVHEKTLDIEIAKELKTRLSMWKAYAHQFCGMDDLPYIAIADPMINRLERTAFEIYEKHAGVSFMPADKVNEAGSRALAQTRVRQHKVMWSLGCLQAETSGCPVAVEQMQGIHWKIQRGSNVVIDETVDEEDEAHDIFRYIENYIHSQIKGITSSKPNKTQILQAQSYSVHKQNHLNQLLKQMMSAQNTPKTLSDLDWLTL